MSQQSTPKRPSNALITPQTPHHPSAKLIFRKDGSLVPDPNPVKLTSPMTLSTPKHKTLTTTSDADLDARLTNILTRFFSTLNDENIFTRTLGKLAPETEFDILGDTDGWDFMQGKEMSREKKMWLVELYEVFDANMRVVLKQAVTYYWLMQCSQNRGYAAKSRERMTYSA